MANHTSVASLVNPNVKTIPVTDEIIWAIMPYFPTSARVISGWLSEEDLYWKVNFHWDYLLEMIEHCSGLLIDQKTKNSLAAIARALWTNAPDPARGYRTSEVGMPRDGSSHELILKRHRIVRQAKRDFKVLATSNEILQKTTRSAKSLALAYAPVAAPGQGKHSTGYALDIKGNNEEIRRVAASLGASLVFDEVSHVHCEWKNGVDTSGRGGSDSVACARRAATMNVANKIVHARHCLLRTD
jgi:hypothetical protein